MANIARREILKNVVPAIATVDALRSGPLHSVWSAARFGAAPGKPRVRQSASRWCYETIPLDELCAQGAEMGLQGIDLLKEDQWEIPLRYGLV